MCLHPLIDSSPVVQAGYQYQEGQKQNTYEALYVFIICIGPLQCQHQCSGHTAQYDYNQKGQPRHPAQSQKIAKKVLWESGKQEQYIEDEKPLVLDKTLKPVV
jgi:hypothetical protein